MNKHGFASMYMVYSLFIIFIVMLLSVLMINNYKRTFLNSLKNDIKDELVTYQLERIDKIEVEETEEIIE